jgi:hypothetical protein
LHDVHPLPDGRRLRLRLPLAADRARLHDLLADLGLEAEELEVRRALRCVPGGRAALCATEWDGGQERLTGFGAADLGRGTLTLLGPPEVRATLGEALCAHAQTWSRRVA